VTSEIFRWRRIFAFVVVVVVVKETKYWPCTGSSSL
jgi:hypothetical protein